jgi:PAS domain S-box-containing protein
MEEVIGKDIHRFCYDKKDKKRIDKMLKDVHKSVTHESVDFFFKNKRAPKKPIFMDMRCHKVKRKEKGKRKQVAIYCILRDITLKRKEEDELKENHMLLRELWDKAPVAYHRVNKEGIIVDVNQTEADLLGFKKSDMIGKSIFDFVLKEQRENAKRRFKLKLKGKHIHHAHDRLYVKKDGTRFYVNIDDALEKDSKGNIIGRWTTRMDIPDQKLAEQNRK